MRFDRLAWTSLVAIAHVVFSLGCTSVLKASPGDLSQAVRQGPEALEALCAKGLSGACALTGQSIPARKSLSILQSVTSAEQSRFVILVPRSERPYYFVRQGSKLQNLTPERFQRSHSNIAVDQIEVFDLQLDQAGQLFVVGEDGELWDSRAFRALDLKQRRVRLAVVSCMDDGLLDPARVMWPQLNAQKPDAMLWIGDNVYADRTTRSGELTAETIWNRYVETRSSLPIFRANPLIPTLAVWDDHDYGKNDSDRTFALKGESNEIFFTFFAQKRAAPGFERGPGISSWWKAFGVQIALLDDRSFRSPNNQDLPDETHFGLDQEKWLLERLNANPRATFLVAGDQFFGGYHKFESFQGSHPKSFNQQLKLWRETPSPLVFVSGDRHLSEIIEVPSKDLGYRTYEITSSGIHARVFADAFTRNPSPQQIAGVAGQYNYSIVELMRSELGLVQFSVQAFGLDSKLLYQKTLTVKRK